MNKIIKIHILKLLKPLRIKVGHTAIATAD